MPEPSSARPRLFTIPPSAPFLTTLARAILAGDLPSPGGLPPDPLALPLTTIYLPTRRAARALREAFLAEAKGEALLLPRIRALGDPDEDAAIIFGAEESLGEDGALGEAAIGALPRRLALMQLVLAFRHLLRLEAVAERGVTASPVVDVTPGQASYLAADLANLIDVIETEEIDLTRLDAIVPEEFAGHWQLTVEFLKIVTEHWPKYLADKRLVSPVARRSLLMAMEAERLARGSPPSRDRGGIDRHRAGDGAAACKSSPRCRTARWCCRGSTNRSTRRAGPRCPSIRSMRKPAWPSCCAGSACGAMR